MSAALQGVRHREDTTPDETPEKLPAQSPSQPGPTYDNPNEDETYQPPGDADGEDHPRR